jgi:riboflavin kinase/FMN adenylyltransferase
MRVEHFPRHVQLEKHGVVTIGVFDGIHLGHKSILDRVLDRSSVVSGFSTLVTFNPHPREIVSGDIVPLLTTLNERIELIRKTGLDRVVVIPFDDEFARLSPEQFVKDVLCERIGMRELVIGYDHGFGKGRRGDIALLRTLAEDLGFSVIELSARKTDHTPISSSAIRQMLHVDGDVEGAALLLGRPYSVSGEVVKGDGRGRVIGYPTANISLGNRRKLVPQRGVYAVRVIIEDSAPPFDAMMNIGFRPTFDGAGMRLEVHVFDMDRTLYGQSLQVEFVERIRDEVKFDGMESLTEQLKEDELRCRRALTIVS